MIKLFLCFLFCALIFSCNKNEHPKPDESGLFVKFFGGAFDDHGFSVAQASDGGFYLAGSTKSVSRPDTNILVVKIDKFGNKVWERSYHLNDTYDEVGRDVIVDANGDIEVSGYKKGLHGMADFLILSIDKDNPDIARAYLFGDPLVDERGYNLVQSADGNFIVYGSSVSGLTSDMLLLKTNLYDTIWDRTIGVFNANDNIGSLKIKSDGNLFWCGSVTRWDGSNMRLVSANAFGNLNWDYSFIDNDGVNQYGYDMAFLNNGGYIVAGSKNRGAGNGIKDIYLVRTNSIGLQPIENSIPGSGSQEAYSIVALDNNQFVLSGYTTSENGDKDIYVATIGESGNVITSKTFGGAGDDIGKKIVKTDDGFIIIGTVEAGNNKMMAVYKVNKDLELAD